MQIYKTFNKVSLKLLPSTIAYFIVFVVVAVILVFNKTNSDTKNNFTAQKVDIAVLDKDNSTLSKALHEYLNSTHTIVEIESDEETLTDALFNRKVMYIVEIPENFEALLLENKDNDILNVASHPDSTSSYLIEAQLSSYLKYLGLYAETTDNLEEAVRLTNETMVLDTKVELHAAQATDIEEIILYYFQYIPYILICMCVCGLGMVLVIFRQKDLNARMQCSATSLTKRNISLFLGSSTYASICYVAFILLAVIIFNKDFFNTKAIFYCLNAFVFLLFSVGFTYLISFFAKKGTTMNMMGNVFGLAFSFLGGIFVPLDIISKDVRVISNFMPTYWYVKANETIANYSGNTEILGQYFKYLGIEFLFVVAILVAALIASKALAVKEN